MGQKIAPAGDQLEELEGTRGEIDQGKAADPVRTKSRIEKLIPENNSDHSELSYLLVITHNQINGTSRC